MKYAWIVNHRDEYTASWLCRVLLVSRTGHCQWRVEAPSRLGGRTTLQEIHQL